MMADAASRSSAPSRSPPPVASAARPFAPPPRIAPQSSPRDWRKLMSGTVAYALLAYTALQISVTMHALADRNTSTLPLFALVILVVAIIPLFRHYERQWEGLSDEAATDPALLPQFRRDQVAVWMFAIGLPFAITAVFKAVITLI